jgi:hypothetical protein
MNGVCVGAVIGQCTIEGIVPGLGLASFTIVCGRVGGDTHKWSGSMRRVSTPSS